MSWPSWLTCSGRFTHIVVTRRLKAERRTGSVRRPKTGILPTVLRNQPIDAVMCLKEGLPNSVKLRNVTAITPFRVIQGHRFLYQSKAYI